MLPAGGTGASGAGRKAGFFFGKPGRRSCPIDSSVVQFYRYPEQKRRGTRVQIYAEKALTRYCGKGLPRTIFHFRKASMAQPVFECVHFAVTERRRRST